MDPVCNTQEPDNALRLHDAGTIVSFEKLNAVASTGIWN